MHSDWTSHVMRPTSIRGNCRAIAYGVTGGKTAALTLLGYGAAIGNVGWTLLKYAEDYGTDPRAFVGWNNQTKKPFLYHMMFSAWTSLLLTFAFLINLSTPKTRKASVVEMLEAKGQVNNANKQG